MSARRWTSSDHFLLSGEAWVYRCRINMQLEVKVHVLTVFRLQQLYQFPASHTWLGEELAHDWLQTSLNNWETELNMAWVLWGFQRSLGETQVCLRCSAERHAFAVLLHQRHQAAWWGSLQQERVLQQISGAGALLRVSSQHAAQEVLQHRGHLNTEWHHQQVPGWPEVQDLWLAM